MDPASTLASLPQGVVRSVRHLVNAALEALESRSAQTADKMVRGGVQL